VCHHVTIILRNAPGAFAGVAKLLQADGVNILAFHVAGIGSNSGYAQLVCDDHLKALAVLTGVFHTYAYESEVIAIRTKNAPGSLYEILSQLSLHKINIESAYQTLHPAGEAIIVIEPNQNDLQRAKDTLGSEPGFIKGFNTIWPKS